MNSIIKRVIKSYLEEKEQSNSKGSRKMSKSYNNTIPLWLPEKKLRKHIMKIKTNSLEPGEPKDPNDSFVFDIYNNWYSY